MTTLILSLTACTTEAAKTELPNAELSKNDLKIAVTSDVHYLSDRLHDGGEAYEIFINTGDGKLLAYTPELMSALEYNLKQEGANVLILTGDLTNNGEKYSHEDLAAKLSEIEKNGTQVYVIPGNHDVNNPYARAFSGEKQLYAEYISEGDFAQIYKDFGYNEALSRDKNSLSYIVAPAKDLRFLMVDTSIYDKNLAWNVSQPNGRVLPETLEWIKEGVKKAKEENAKVIGVMHHNIMDHNESLKEGFTLDNSLEVRDTFTELEIPLVFSGHIHIQDIRAKGYVTEIVSEALGIWPHLHGLLTFGENDLNYEAIPVDMEAYARANNIDDEILLNFAEFSENKFSQRAYTRTKANLANAANLSEEDIEAMARTNEKLNVAFFGGREIEVIEEIKESYGYKKWIEYKDERFSYYLSSIIHGEDSLDTQFHMEF